MNRLNEYGIEPFTDSPQPTSPPMVGPHRPMGGDNLITRQVLRESVSLSTISLGGIETRDGLRGFIGCGHIVVEANSAKGFASSEVIYALAYHHRNANQPDLTATHIPLIGRVAAVPRVLVHDAFDVSVDAAFFAYPREPVADCTMNQNDEATGERFCLDFGIINQVERVQPLTIRGKGNAVYTVVGSCEPTAGLEVWISGMASRRDGRDVIEGGTVDPSGRQIIESDTGAKRQYLVETEFLVTGSDNGGPVYTVPDAHDHVRIVGIVNGRVEEENFTVFSSWQDITDTLNLKPIGS